MCLGSGGCFFDFDIPPQDNPRVKDIGATGQYAYGKELTAEDDSVPWSSYLRIEMSLSTFDVPGISQPEQRVFVYPADSGKQFLLPLSQNDDFGELKFYLSDIREQTLDININTLLSNWDKSSGSEKLSKSFTVTAGTTLWLITPTLDNTATYIISYVRG
jgi:hypothetical protein